MESAAAARSTPFILPFDPIPAPTFIEWDGPGILILTFFSLSFNLHVTYPRQCTLTCRLRLWGLRRACPWGSACTWRTPESQECVTREHAQEVMQARKLHLGKQHTNIILCMENAYECQKKDLMVQMAFDMSQHTKSQVSRLRGGAFIPQNKYTGQQICWTIAAWKAKSTLAGCNEEW